jgi:hypothetical protein
MDKNCIDILSRFFKIAKAFTPSAIGLLDEITDILYYAQTDFSNKSIEFLCLFFLLFSAFLHFMIWTIYSANKYILKLRN